MPFGGPFALRPASPLADARRASEGFGAFSGASLAPRVPVEFAPYDPGLLSTLSPEVLAAYTQLERGRMDLELAARDVDKRVYDIVSIERQAGVLDKEIRLAEAASSTPPGGSSPPRVGGCSQVSRVSSWRAGVLGRAQSVVSWRSGRSSSSGFSTEGGAEPAAESVCDRGRCYTALASPGSRSSLSRRCGKWPAVSRLLALPASEVSMAKMSEHVLVRSDGNKWHVAPASGHPPAAATVSDVLGRMVREFSDVLEVGDSRWSGTVLESVALRPEPLGSFDLPGLADRVGGEPVACVTYPSDLARLPRCTPSVYLGGTVEKDRSVHGWRSVFMSTMSAEFPACVVLSPRPLSGEFEDVDDAKRSWEREAMDRADVVVLNFLSDSVSSVSLLELGLYAGSGKLVVSCPRGYARYDSVRHTCARSGVPLFHSWVDAGHHVSAVLRGGAVGGYGFGQGAVDRGVGRPEAERLQFETDGFGLVVSAFTRCEGGSEVLHATFSCSSGLRRGVSYSFVVPGESGVARLHKPAGFVVEDPEGFEDGHYVLECGKSYAFVVDVAMAAFVPTFLYGLGECRVVQARDSRVRGLLGPRAVAALPRAWVPG